MTNGQQKITSAFFTIAHNNCTSMLKLAFLKHECNCTFNMKKCASGKLISAGYIADTICSFHHKFDLELAITSVKCNFQPLGH